MLEFLARGGQSDTSPGGSSRIVTSLVGSYPQPDWPAYAKLEALVAGARLAQP